MMVLALRSRFHLSVENAKAQSCPVTQAEAQPILTPSLGSHQH